MAEGAEEEEEEEGGGEEEERTPLEVSARSDVCGADAATSFSSVTFLSVSWCSAASLECVALSSSRVFEICFCLGIPCALSPCLAGLKRRRKRKKCAKKKKML